MIFICSADNSCGIGKLIILCSLSDSCVISALVLQVRSDWYTLIVLSVLPWVARELYSKKPNDLDRLLSTVDSYMR